MNKELCKSCSYLVCSDLKLNNCNKCIAYKFNVKPFKYKGKIYVIKKVMDNIKGNIEVDGINFLLVNYKLTPIQQNKLIHRLLKKPHKHISSL